MIQCQFSFRLHHFAEPSLTIVSFLDFFMSPNSNSHTSQIHGTCKGVNRPEFFCTQNAQSSLDKVRNFPSFNGSDFTSDPHAISTAASGKIHREKPTTSVFGWRCGRLRLFHTWLLSSWLLLIRNEDFRTHSYTMYTFVFKCPQKLSKTKIVCHLQQSSS